MKIAFFHELHRGGARRASNEYSKYLRKNHSVDLFLVDVEIDESENEFYDVVNFFKFTSKKWTGNDWKTKINKDFAELVKIRSLHKKIAEEIDKNEYDVVLVFPSQYTQAPFVLEFLKTKNFYFVMEPLRLVYDPLQRIPEELKLSRKTYEKLNRFVRKQIDKRNVDHAKNLIAPSVYSADWSKRVYKKNVDVVYPGVRTAFFTDVNKKRDIDILYVGSKDLLNGYDFFKKINEKIDANLKIKKVLTENQWLTDVHLRDLYRRTKILVAISRNEPLGLIPLEAMSCGAVIVAINEAGYKETVVDGKNGYLISNKPELFAKKIKSLLKNSENLEKMSKNAIKNMNENWTWELQAKRLERALFGNQIKSN